MIKKILMPLFILLMITLQLHATSNDEDFLISINNWFCSVQWTDEVDLQYLDKQETYYDFLKIIFENYDYISSLSDAILFYVQRNNDGYRLTTYFNDKELKTYDFSSLRAFQHILREQLNSFYSFESKKNYFYLYKVTVPVHKGDFLRDVAEIRFHSSSETISNNGFYEYIFIRTAVLKKYDKNDYEIKCHKIYMESRNGEVFRQHNGGGASEDSSQEDAEEQEEERNPSVTNAQWKDADGEPITKALVSDEVTLCADVQDIPDGTSARIKVVEKDADGNDDDVATLTATVSNGKIECAWKVIYTEDDDDTDSEQEKAEKGYTLPEYAFTVECDGVTSGESGRLEIKDEIIITVKNFEKLKGKTLKLVWRDGSSKTVTIDSQKIIVKDIFIGSASIKIM